MPHVLNAIDIYTLPSLWEGLPIELLEAMAMSKPIVATGVDGSKEVVKDGINETLIECGDDEGLANAFIELYQDTAKMAEFGKRLSEIILTNYTVNRMCREVEAISLHQL
jgi:glycosyltransferase involved in cell wall biosynthesis